MDGSQLDISIPNDLKVIEERTSDYQVEIAQIAQGIKETVPVICTRGVICSDEPFMSGIIYSTQVLVSMNLTVQQLTEIQVKNPEYATNY